MTRGTLLKELDRQDARKRLSDCVKNAMESLRLSQKDVQFRNKWRRELRGQPANQDSPGKMAVHLECVCVVCLMYVCMYVLYLLLLLLISNCIKRDCHMQ